MSEIRQITPQLNDQDEVVRMFETLLEHARDGQIISAGVCAVRLQGQTSAHHAGRRDNAALMGTTHMLQNLIYSNWMGDDDA